MESFFDRLLSSRHAYAWLVLLCALLWLPGFFTLPPTDRDESRFVQATRQMLDSGDFVSIRNGAVARNQKPIGIYWLQAPFAAAARSVGLATENPVWPYRIPSLLGGVIGVLATFWIGRLLVGERSALLGAGMLMVSPVLAVETHLAKTDASLLALTTAAMGLLAYSYLAPARMPRWAWAWFWIALGGGILIKGPITPMVVGLTAVTLAIADVRQGPPRWLLRLRPGWGVLLMMAVTLPWFIAIGIRTNGAFFQQSVGGDLAEKMVGGDDGHAGLPGWHLLLLSMNLFPSGCMVLPALPAAWRARRLPAIRFLLAWVIPGWLVFEAVPTKLPHYTLPLLPAVCMLGAAWALDPHTAPLWLRRVAMGATIIAAVAFGVGSAVLPVLAGARTVPTVLLGVPSLLAAGLIIWLLLRQGPMAGLAAAPLLIWSIIGLELPMVPELWVAPRVRTALAVAFPAAAFPAGVTLGSAGYAEPSLMFLCGTSTAMLPDGKAGAIFLDNGPNRATLVNARDQPSFAMEAGHLHLSPRLIGEVDGFNYSNGRQVKLQIYTKE